MYQEFLHYATRHKAMSRMHLEHYFSKTHTPQAGISPAVIEERQLNMVQLDVFSRLMMDRIIFLGVPIDAYVANVVQAQLLFLDSVDPKRDVQMFINSPGGSVIDGFGIYDTMQYISSDITTMCTSMAASMSAFLLCAGTKGKRSALPHARVMIHQTSGGSQGSFSDMEITYELFKKLQDELFGCFAEHTGQSFEQISKDCDRDNWMTAPEAQAYGLIDEVLVREK